MTKKKFESESVGRSIQTKTICREQSTAYGVSIILLILVRVDSIDLRNLIAFNTVA